MKKTLLILITLLISFLSMAEDAWPGKCDSLTVTYELKSTSDPLVFEMEATITNEATTNLGTYCDVSNLVSSPNVSISNYDPACYGDLIAGGTKLITMTITRTDASIEKFDLFFKVKHGLDDSRYCSETKTHWFNAPIGIEEIDRMDMEYTVSYFDLMGREISQPSVKGFYIVEKLFEDGFKAIEKVYLTQPGLN